MNFLNFFENKLLLEMAKQGDRPRGAIKLDDDDIELEPDNELFENYKKSLTEKIMSKFKK